jgi:hypothetical protein
MSEKKISALASASALTGAEVLPIVQSGATKKVTADQVATFVASAITPGDIGGAGGSANTFTDDQQIDSDAPRYLFNETGQAANEGLWDVGVDAKTFFIRSRTDGDGAGVDVLRVTRGTGTALSELIFGAGQASFNFANGAFQLSALSLQANNPQLFVNEFDAPTNEKYTMIEAQAGVLTFKFISDDFGTTRNWLSVSRNGVAFEKLEFGNGTDNPEYTFLGTGTPGHGSTTLLRTTIALANGAAAAAGTLTNAPAAGNPTKWIPINDNGTTRYVPAW